MELRSHGRLYGSTWNLTARRSADSMKRPQTIKELRLSKYTHMTVKQEMRKNLVALIEAGEELFPGIVGYEKTVLPQIENAILSGHDFILLGLRGQAKTRILRALVRFLDEG